VLAMPASSMMINVAGPTPVAQSGSPPFRSDQASAVVGSLGNACFSGRASIEYSQPRVISSYGVAWRYHQVTPQVRRAQTVMPVELLTFLLPGNTEPCVDQRPGPLRRTPRRSPTHRQTARTPTLIEHLRDVAQGRDDIRTECAGTIVR
jgi:hypothetical protein